MEQLRDEPRVGWWARVSVGALFAFAAVVGIVLLLMRAGVKPPLFG